MIQFVINFAFVCLAVANVYLTVDSFVKRRWFFFSLMLVASLMSVASITRIGSCS